MKNKNERVVDQVSTLVGIKEYETVYTLTYVMDHFIKNEINYTSFKLFLLKSVLDNKTFNSLNPSLIESLNYMNGGKKSIKEAYQELYDKNILWREKDNQNNFISNKIHINYNKKRINESGLKFNPKIYFKSFYLRMFLVSSILTERLARFLCVILMNIQSVPVSDTKIIKDSVFFRYLTSYSYSKKLEIIHETLLKLEYHGCIKIISYANYSYTIQLTNFVDQDTILKIKDYLKDKKKFKVLKVKEQDNFKINETNILEKEALEQQKILAQRKAKDFQNKYKYKLEVGTLPINNLPEEGC